MKKVRAPTQEEAGVLIAMLAVIFGGWVRLFPPSIAGFPINDGGLFTVMIRAIQADGLKLPAYFQYNGQSIPFAYPPLALYVGAIISYLFHLDAIDVVRWLPAIILIGTVPAFYYLAKGVLNSSFRAGLATFAFAFTPRTMTWTIMGGGLTRSFGMLFLLLTLANLYRLFDARDRKYLAPSILFSALVVLAHPEAALHTIALAILFWIFKGGNKDGIVNAITIGVGTIAVTSIWWIPTLLRLGPDPFLAAAQTGSHSALSFLYPFLLTLTDESFLTIIAVLGLIGFIVCITNKDYFLPVFYFVPFIVDPRSSATYAMIPLTMMAGLALSEIILPGLSQLERKLTRLPIENLFQSRMVNLSLIVFGLYLLGGTMYFGTQVAATAVSAADRAAFSWISTNTPPNSRFLVMTGENEILCDGVQEWFPVLANRVDILTIQGDEWLPGKKYIQAVNLQSGTQACVNDSDPLDCIGQNKLEYNYIYVARQSTLKNLCRAIAPVKRGEGLIAELDQNPQYQLAYQTNGVAIFSYQH